MGSDSWPNCQCFTGDYWTNLQDYSWLDHGVVLAWPSAQFLTYLQSIQHWNLCGSVLVHFCKSTFTWITSNSWVNSQNYQHLHVDLHVAAFSCLTRVDILLQTSHEYTLGKVNRQTERWALITQPLCLHPGLWYIDGHFIWDTHTIFGYWVHDMYTYKEKIHSFPFSISELVKSCFILFSCFTHGLKVPSPPILSLLSIRLGDMGKHTSELWLSPLTNLHIFSSLHTRSFSS